MQQSGKPTLPPSKKPPTCPAEFPCWSRVRPEPHAFHPTSPDEQNFMRFYTTPTRCICTRFQYLESDCTMKKVPG